MHSVIVNKKRFVTNIATLVIVLAIGGCSKVTSNPEQVKNTVANESLAPSLQASMSSNPWYQSAENSLQSDLTKFQTIQPQIGSAKNVILFVGDGMSIATITAARILDGQLRGESGEENQLSFEKFPFTGFSKTYNVDAQTPDSAGTMTAMMSGVKTDAGIIGLSEKVSRGDCASSKGTEVISALELAEIAGMGTGIVTTARLTHATPAATYAHSPDRDWEDVSDMPTEAIAQGCVDIADQFVHFKERIQQEYGVSVDGIDVAMGGGRRHFLPKDAAFNSPDAVSAIEGDRTDNRDLIAEWKKLYPSGQYVMDQTGFDALTTAAQLPVLGLFNESHMRYEMDRKNDVSGEPSLSEMTAKAIQLLEAKDKNKGYFLMVEAGRIDHGHHAGSAFNALHESIELSQAVAKAQASTNPNETLIIVTSDHSHVFTMAGYPKRGNPILGKVVSVGSDQEALALDDMPYTTLGYANGRGFKDLGDETDGDLAYEHPVDQGRKDLNSINTQTPGYHQEALIPLESETHSGEDVGIFSTGPGAHLVSGVHEQNVIFHIMNYAANLTGKATSTLPKK
ncbi:MAG: alkaline phosphatase [Gammaproteobacteria bacterium]|jgi:alkaline phosphatase|uniref:alkaline phosphatase n=1 Tax=Thalassolituus oleivorans TaxID=187493 RepID=UPI0023F29CD7|nr:alkaline phosphatase [Thalassolituus oleivorans]